MLGMPALSCDKRCRGVCELIEKLAWAGALKDWSGPVEGERPTGYIAILAQRPAPGKPAAPITEADAGIAAQTMMLAARSATPEVAACMLGFFPPRAIDVMGLDGDKYEVKLIMAFGVPAETQVIDAVDSNPDGSINYWRDEAQVHHVPKRPLPTYWCSCVVAARIRRQNLCRRSPGVIIRWPLVASWEGELRARMVAALTRIMARPQHDCVLAVSHGSACHEFLRCVTGGGEQPDNGAVLQFGYFDGAFSLLGW